MVADAAGTVLPSQPQVTCCFVTGMQSLCPTLPPPLPCCLQIKVEPPALFSVHLDLNTVDGNAARVSIGNILKDAATHGKVEGR